MGQSQTSNNLHPQQDLFIRQIRIYQWRADSNFNIFIPRVYFRSVFAQLQQQKFGKFIEQQSDKPYFEISKFKQQLHQVPRTTDDQVIVFQNYQCTLNELQGKLNFQQGLYSLQALLVGYQQIKKVYQAIVIDSRCCFVTIQGSLRAWINPNSKSNRLWNEQQGETVRHNIIHKIVKMVEQSTQISPKSEQFFANLLLYTTHRQVNCSYSELRRWINEYCFTHSILMAKKILLRNKTSKSYQSHSRKTQFYECQQQSKENNALFLSTQQSQNNRPFHKFRSLEKHIGLTSSVFEVRNSNIAQPVKQISMRPDFQLQHSTSQIFKPRVQTNPTPIPAMMPAAPQPNLLLKENKQPQIFQVGRISQEKNKFSFKSSKNIQLVSKKSIQNQHLKLSQQHIQVVLQKKSTIRREVRKIEKPREERKGMQVSIMQNIVDTNQVRKQSRHKTYIEKEYSQVDSDPKSIIYSRPWITTKTITKLISDNEQMYSLKNSIGQSSDYYNGSVYSGVLTQMGRDVTKPINQGRSKTIGISQEL